MFIHQTGYRGSGNTVLAAKAANPSPPTRPGRRTALFLQPHLQLFLTILTKHVALILVSSGL
jgi:hypothetical protein